MGIRHSIVGLLEILNWMEGKGHSRQALLHGTQIDDARLTDPKATLLPEEELQFYRNLLKVSGDTNIFLESGFNLKLATYGVWGLALISSPTFGKAIELGIQYIDFTYTYNDISFFEDGSQAGIRISKSAELGDLQKSMIERDISATFVLLQTLLQQDRPAQEIRFSWDNSAPLAYYETLFGCRICFNQPETEVRFDQEYLAHELPQHNVLAMQLCTEQLEKIRPQLFVAQGLVEWVQEYLLSTPLYRVSMEACAKELNMSSRNLRRKLKEEGSSYKDILDEFRFALSQKYLRNTRMTLEEIADRLGYSDAANFSHAYKRWSGEAPRQSH